MKIQTRTARRSDRRAAAVLAAATTPAVETLEDRRLFSVPNGPYAFTAAATAPTQASLHWYNSATDATGIQVMRQGSGGAWQTIATLDPSATGFVDNSVSTGAAYNYTVFAFNGSGDSCAPVAGPVTPTSGTTAAEPSTVARTTVPDAPFALSARADSYTQVTLNWYDSDKTGASYRVMRSTPGGSWQPIAYLGANATSYTDTTVAPGTTYSYVVCAYNVVGDSNLTGIGNVTTPGGGGAAGPAAGGVAGSGGSSANASGTFPVGVFYQPSYSFSTWSSRGVNLMFGYEKGAGDSMAQYDAAAQAYGFKEIRQPSANPSADAAMSNLLAWLAPQDEPDLNGTPASAMTSQYAQLKGANGNIPVMTNLAGGDLLGMQGGTSTGDYQQLLSNTDMDAADIYPVTGWGLPNQVGLVGQVVDKLKSYAPGKQSYAFIETSNQQLSWVPNDTGVTPDQLRGEIWDSVIHGASGIVYFPQQIGNGFQFDATPANVAAEMTTQNARLQHFAAALLQGTNTGGVSATGTGPLEVATRVYNGHTYFFVLNLSNQTLSNQTTNVSGISSGTTLNVDGESRSVQVNGNAITDSFAPYQLHVYVA